MKRPKCERCGGALMGEYPEPGILVVKCPVCGWRRTRETPEHPVLTVAEAKSGVRIDFKKQEAEMAKQQECRRCGRMIQLVKDGSCDRCLRRIAKGLDPVTGEPIVTGERLRKNMNTVEIRRKGLLVPEPLMVAPAHLAEEAERVTELGEIDGAELSTDAEWEVAGWVKKSTDDGSDPLLPENWGKIPCVRCGKLVQFGEVCHCVPRGLPDDSEGGEEWYEDEVEVVPPPVTATRAPVNPKDVAEAHVLYTKETLQVHGIGDDLIHICMHHYRTAFVHGWKHGQGALQ